jgi:hypothetical protein
VSSIRRGNDWWHRRSDGVWLLWSTLSQSWEPQSGSPPPPPPPPLPVGPPAEPVAAAAPEPAPAAAPEPAPAAAVPAGVAVSTAAPPAVAERSPVTAPAPVAVAPAAAPAPAAVQEAPAPVAGPAPAPVVQEAPAPVAHPAPAEAPDPVPADGADTTPMPSVDLPVVPVPAPGSRAANGEMYSKGEIGFLARFQSRTLMVVGGTVAIVAVFALTYLGASFFFRPPDDAAAAGVHRKVSPRQAFLIQVDDICARASQSAMGLPPPGTPSQMAHFTKTAIRTQRGLISDMSKIVPPAKKKVLYRTITKESKDQLVEMKALLAEASSGDPAGTQAAMQTVAASEKRIDRMSAGLGLKDCG